ncbi:hypothetical protein [uncultured Psychrobacter sp.]|uniref:hypothetical protein n=1 Tax=uncultured Psychrobacter sp. TaxID=259303 RepID=UPI0030D7A8BD
MKIRILETDKIEMLDVKDWHGGDSIGMSISQSDFDWWQDHITDIDVKSKFLADFRYIKTWPVQLLQAIIEMQRETSQQADISRIGAIESYFGDTEEDEPCHKIKNLRILSRLESDEKYDYEFEHDTSRCRFAFTLSDVLVPKEREASLVFEKMDLDVEIEGRVTESFVDCDDNSIVVKTPYFKNCSKHLNNADEYWTTIYFKYLVFWCSSTHKKTLGELALDSIKDTFASK